MTRFHPFRTPRLSGPQVGWFRPAAAILIAMIIPCLIAIAFTLFGTPTIAGPPKDGSGYTFADHIAVLLASLSASIIVSWVIAPIALLALRAAAMLGWAGWGTAMLSALVFGLPVVDVVLNADLTTDEFTFLPHISIAIAFLGLSVWAAFWGLIALAQKSPNFSSI